MRITKFGHSCLLVEEGSARILIDPGSYSVVPDLENLDAIVITHEHQDHFDLATIARLLEKNPDVVIYTNAEVGGKLVAEDIPFHELGDGQTVHVKDVTIEGSGMDHAIIHPSFPRAKNTGYFIAGRLFHPGDALHVPPKPVEILALPVVAPWSKISETIDYLTAIKPACAFAIHDGFLKPGLGLYSRMNSAVAEKQGTKWIDIEDGKPIEF